MYLLDTPILFELRGARGPGADARLAAWAGATPRERLFVSAVSLVEVEGAALRATRNDRADGAGWREWIDTRLIPAFEGHVLPVDGAVARRRGTLAIADTRDALIAATAVEHGLTLVTRDRGAYKGARVRMFDPSSRAPGDVAPGDIGPAEAEDWRSAGRNGPNWLKSLFIRG
jgi:predicted nucleic acid-binding protein